MARSGRVSLILLRGHEGEFITARCSFFVLETGVKGHVAGLQEELVGRMLNISLAAVGVADGVGGFGG